MVLSLYPVLKSNVALEAVRSHLISSKSIVSKSQLPHLQMAWLTTMPLSSWPIWTKFTPTAAEINHPGIPTGESKAGNGARVGSRC